MTTRLNGRKTSVIFTASLIVGLAVALVWWFAIGPGKSEVTTGNPCTGVTEHYDVEGRTYAGNDLVGRYLAEVSPVAVLTTFQDNNGRAQAQRLWVGDTWDTDRSESRSVVLSRSTSSGIEYDRVKTSDGSWGPWDSERKSLESESGASGFCGYSNDHITNVERGGTEKVLGVPATKYIVDYYADATSILMNFWVDSSGLLIRKILIYPSFNQRHEWDYINRGQVNEITIPGN